jgi:hypothetical protein
MAASYLDLYIDQGSDYNNQIALDDAGGAAYNLVGFSVSSAAKTSYYTANTALVFNATVVDPVNGIIQLSANSAVTSNVSAMQKLVYDVVVTDPNGINSRVLEGHIYVSPGVTGITLTS